MDATGKRVLGFMPGGPIPESFFEPLPEDELRRWECRETALATEGSLPDVKNR
jgi:hypothetical protein